MGGWENWVQGGQGLTSEALGAEGVGLVSLLCGSGQDHEPLWTSVSSRAQAQEGDVLLRRTGLHSSCALPGAGTRRVLDAQWFRVVVLMRTGERQPWKPVHGHGGSACSLLGKLACPRPQAGSERSVACFLAVGSPWCWQPPQRRPSPVPPGVRSRFPNCPPGLGAEQPNAEARRG